ncbi:MAG: ATP-binding cassette domain-containing protein, partial [Sphaerochaetaceae bacterium]|nr:ATP-binding cassette domain-containing protein [Sphaerochaetaceae bacterium]
MTVLSTKDLVFSYPDSQALHFRDFEIEEGGFVCIKGDMGSGKTTLAKLLSGLEKPSGGAVLYRGKDIWESRASRKAFSGKVALLFQFSSDQLFEKTVLEDVMFG